jgi:hypothetical protein
MTTQEIKRYHQEKKGHIWSLVNQYRELQLKRINDVLNGTWYFSTDDEKRMKDIVDTLHSIGFGREI